MKQGNVIETISGTATLDFLPLAPLPARLDTLLEDSIGELEREKHLCYGIILTVPGHNQNIT